ncbi:CBO0543 family protein [Neobacillus endophyticus]|uniref:CBO0543 family protein n=1 Tax=Neobacillus endophyticus TaxID=2738405 RepID=UPI001C25B0F3|nr:CBO0543 family protein [Neobacillus endophyticus]
MLNLTVIFIPKRLSGIEMLSIILFSHALEVLADYIFDVMYNMYGYFDKGPEWWSFIYVYGIYPAISVLFLNFFPYGKRFMKIVLYIAAWVLIALIFEKAFLWSKTFYYNSWNMGYSLVLYPGLYLALVLSNKFTRYLVKKVQLKW